jgi:hypothetical protein
MVGAAAGHGSERVVEPVSAGLDPRASGVTVEVRTIFAPALFVRNDGDALLEVLGSDGRPFVRIGPRGTEGNVSSPELFTSNTPVPGAPVPGRARPGAQPVWLTLARAPAWSWFEHRLDPRSAQPGEQWTIPARVAGRPARIRGRWARVESRGFHRTVVEAIRPQPAGVSVTVLANGPVLLVRNTGRERLEIEDANGKPFLRVGPGGVDLRPAGSVWEKMGDTRAWAWFERRASGSGNDPPRGLGQATAVTPVRNWSVRARLGGRSLVISGRVEWVPVAAHHGAADDGGLGAALLVVAVSAPLVVAALILVVRRGREAAA